LYRKSCAAHFQDFAVGAKADARRAASATSHGNAAKDSQIAAIIYFAQRLCVRQI
jgi:hypothetical protein